MSAVNFGLSGEKNMSVQDDVEIEVQALVNVADQCLRTFFNPEKSQASRDRCRRRFYKFLHDFTAKEAETEDCPPPRERCRDGACMPQ